MQLAAASAVSMPSLFGMGSRSAGVCLSAHVLRVVARVHGAVDGGGGAGAAGGSWWALWPAWWPVVLLVALGGVARWPLAPLLLLALWRGLGGAW